MREFIFVILFLTVFSAAAADAQQRRQFTGTYRHKGDGRANEIKVLQTGANEIKVSFEGIYQFKIPGGHLNTRTGGIEPQTIKLEAGRAILTSEDATGCRLTLTFLSGGATLKVVQNENDCGFAEGVEASGVYRRTSAREPKFSNDSGVPHGAPTAANLKIELVGRTTIRRTLDGYAS